MSWKKLVTHIPSDNIKAMLFWKALRATQLLHPNSTLVTHASAELNMDKMIYSNIMRSDINLENSKLWPECSTYIKVECSQNGAGQTQKRADPCHEVL